MGEEEEEMKIGWPTDLNLAIYDDIDHHCGFRMHMARSKWSEKSWAAIAQESTPIGSQLSHKTSTGSYSTQLVY